MRILSLTCALLALPSLATAQLTVLAIDPALNAMNREPNTSIVVDFDRAVASASLGNFRVYGRNGGAIAGTLTLENGDTRLRFRPLKPFFADETVSVGMNEDLQAQDGAFLRTEGYVASFRVRAAPASRVFTEIASWSVSTGSFERIYGGQSADLDHDGFGDLAIICENSSDVRVYMSNHDGMGSFGPLMAPPNSTGSTPSPNENADMDGDGEIDIVTCDVLGNSVSILLGNGDGTFQPAVTYPIGGPCHGLAVFDADGDGDVDVALPANDQVKLRLNNGDGTLGPISSTSTAVTSDYGLTAADMNNDGIVDLVVGGSGGSLMTLLSDGDGTFTPKPTQNAGGFAWMVVCGDVNGDGKIDATVANGGNGRGSVLLGNGDGTFQPPFSTSSFGHVVATDLGDLDGDGDLDWVLSSYGGGIYKIWINNGAGVFTFDQNLPGVQNPACCTILDIDGDRDMDLALLDETTDIIRILENGTLEQETFCYGTLAACPCGNAGTQGHGCENSDGTGGALLLPQGEASVANDSLALNVGGLPSSSTLVFFQGTAQIGGGLGTVFGDGLLCAGGTVKRLGPKAGVNGFASFGAGQAGDPLISLKGGIPAPGGTYHYQVWYRNNVAWCTAATYNLSNGVRLIWTP